MGRVKANEAGMAAYAKNVASIQDASNRKYRTEQLKLMEARQAQAFKSQEIYAKMIGAQGKVLAQGQTGQSIGAQVNDAARQAGFANAKKAQPSSPSRCKLASQWKTAAVQEESALNSAWNGMPAPVAAPMLAKDPGGGVYTGSMAIPTYNWS